MNTSLIHPVDLTLPDLPGKLEGLRIAHITDLHIRGRRRRHQQIVQLLSRMRLDLIFFTGDYISEGRFTPVALPVMRELTASLRCRLGMFGVFGNHDTPQLRDAFATLPITWLDNQSHHVDALPLQIMGLEMDRYHDPDPLAMLEHAQGQPRSSLHDGAVRLLLCHRPAFLPVAADMGFDIMFAGHTHGGQMRLPARVTFYNSSDFPMHLTSGILRLRDTICVVSRGLGEIHLPMRTFCPPHLPVFTLRRGPMPGQRTSHIENVVPW